jgi:hypothetical protein
MEKFCTNCGEPLKPHYKVCPNCGQPVNRKENHYDDTYVSQLGGHQNEEGDTFVWGILGFFFPLVGLILFLVWQGERPMAAKSAGTGALIGFVFGTVFGSFFITGI